MLYLKNLIIKKIVEMAKVDAKDGNSSLFFVQSDNIVEINCTAWMTSIDTQRVLSLAIQLTPLYIDVDCLAFFTPVTFNELFAKYLDIDFGDSTHKVLFSSNGLVCDVEVGEGGAPTPSASFQSLLTNGLRIRSSCERREFECLNGAFTKCEIDKARELAERLVAMSELSH
jgi:hypothetical protein